MRPIPEETLNEKLHFLRSESKNKKVMIYSNFDIHLIATVRLIVI